MTAPVPVPRPASPAPEQEAVRAQVAQNPAATLSDLLGAGYSWQEIFAMGKLGPFKTFEDAYANAQKQQPGVTKLYPIPTETKELPPSPVKGTNEQGETTYTFTQGMMGQLITQVARDSFTARDPNSNIGINPPRTQAEADALPQDPISTLARNANATPLPDDVLAQLRMDAQAKQQALGSPRPATPLVR